MVQELNIVEREENYMSPYAKASQQKREVLPEQTTPKEERGKKAKGPSLSGFCAKKELYSAQWIIFPKP